jgi:hypothetical protein
MYIQSKAHGRGKGLPLFMMVFVSKLVGNYITPAYGDGIKHATCCLMFAFLQSPSNLIWILNFRGGGGFCIFGSPLKG